MSFRQLQLVPLVLSLAVPWAIASCSSSDSPTGTGGTGATGGTAPTGGMPGSGGGNGGKASGGAPTGGAPTGGVGGTASGSSGAGGAKAGSGGLGTGDAGMSGEGGMNETGGTAGSGTAGSGTAGSGMAGSGTAGSGTAGSGTAGSGAGGASSGTFTLTIAGFTPMAGCSEDMPGSCAVWPRDLQQYMMGPNLSPEMSWTGAPTGTMSYAIVLVDLSTAMINVHWAIWNIPASVTMVAEDIPKTSAMPATPAGSQQANLSTGDGYFGPGSECNVYEFTVYALSVPTFSPSNTMMASNVRTELLALGSQILGTASVLGRQDFNGTCNP
jgi:Raf kinase inhibitor-like YbhB/YbcL family protein